MTYSGEGWQKIGGEWYYFAPGTLKAVGGWFKDPGSGYWYYFDPSTKQMQVGFINVDGVRYFLNDGSVSGVPAGAWIEGR